MTDSVPRASSAYRSRVLRLVVDHNPFYLLSAVCMLAGCLTLTNTLSYSPIPWKPLVTLVGTLAAYEVLLVAIGIFLIVGRSAVRRDGMALLLIETLFLVDMAFLNAEVYSVRPALGAIVNVLLLLLAVAKLSFIFSYLGWSFTDGLFALTIVQAVCLHGIPGVFAWIALSHDGKLPAGVMYAAWWAAGLLPVLYVLIVRPRDLITRRTGDVVRDVLAKVLLVAPIVSLIVHLATANWVYKLEFYSANFSPLLLGLAVLAGHHSQREITRGRRVWAQFALPGLAVVFSMSVPDALTYVAPGPDWSVLRVALLGAAVVYIDAYLNLNEQGFVYAAAGCAGLFLLGTTMDEVHRTTSKSVSATSRWLEFFIPETPRDWGVASVVTSFLLLAAGFALSLMKSRMRPMPMQVIIKVGDDSEPGG